MSIELKYGNKKFMCLHCNTVAKQDWFKSTDLGLRIVKSYDDLYLSYRERIDTYDQKPIREFLNTSKIEVTKAFKYYLPSSLTISECHSCNNYILWVNKDIVYPRKVSIDSPNLDMDKNIQDLYNEASLILFDSPKGASALLRLSLQKLLIQLGEKGKDINKDIASLVSKGLSPKLQQALDFVRVVGNESVHPGTIDLDDNLDIAISLFKLLNFITEEMITKPKEIENMYENIIPQNKKDAIEKRDSKE